MNKTRISIILLGVSIMVVTTLYVQEAARPASPVVTQTVTIEPDLAPKASPTAINDHSPGGSNHDNSGQDIGGDIGDGAHNNTPDNEHPTATTVSSGQPAPVSSTEGVVSAPTAVMVPRAVMAATQVLEPAPTSTDLVLVPTPTPQVVPVATPAPKPVVRSYMPIVAVHPPEVEPEPTEPEREENEPEKETPVKNPAGKTFYIDCQHGGDNQNGHSPKSAWKTLPRANLAKLQPGDSLLLKRGCKWTGPLNASWQGTSSRPILIGAYGRGDLPTVQDAHSANVRISGKYQIIQDIHATLSTRPNPDPNCNNQPRGWKAGFSFEAGSSYNTVRAVQATQLTIGVFFHLESHHNRLLNSTITDNHVLEKLTSTGAHGATGVSLHGNYQEVARNYFANNHSLCTYDGVQESIAIELYTTSNSSIHHNQVYNDRVFIEMGSNPRWHSENNTIAYNLHVSDYSHATMGARFLVTRGYGHVHGPVLETKVLNNLVYLTGSGSKGISCQQCDNNILTVHNNILWANNQPFSTDNRFVESHNIFWSNEGNPNLRWHGFTKSATSYIADPQFTDPGANRFRLKDTSPAINRGTIDFVAAGHGWDLAGTQVPIAGAVDIGAFEAQ